MSSDGPNQNMTPRPVLPSWLLSVVIHVVLVVVLGLMIKVTPRGAAEEPSREVGIVLKHTTDQGEFYEGEDDQPRDADSTNTTTQESNALEALPSESAQLDPSDALPKQAALVGPAATQPGGVQGAGDLTSGTGQPKRASGGQAKVSVYGVEGEGTKFVYVFDRSVSMAGGPLASAKQQLINSLDSLYNTHQFQIIFFNHNRRIFDLSGGQQRIPFANDRTKQLARKFVGEMTASGGTDRYAALSAAVNMRPDVIFFLSDADDPMSPADVARIERRNRGTAAINTIEFGFGRSTGSTNFLVRLARENGGQYTYVDISRLGR